MVRTIFVYERQKISLTFFPRIAYPFLTEIPPSSLQLAQGCKNSNFVLSVLSFNRLYLMAIVPCGSTWVARWGVQPQFISRPSITNKLLAAPRW